jgi:hypothetical protein
MIRGIRVSLELIRAICVSSRESIRVSFVISV